MRILRDADHQQQSGRQRSSVIIQHLGPAMSATPFVPLTCPHCLERVEIGARRLRPGGCLPCPACAAAIILDGRDPEIADALTAARLARAERKASHRALMAQWRLPGGEAPMPQADIPDILAGLDKLMGRLDTLMSSPSPQA
jgi:hypothetical protein